MNQLVPKPKEEYLISIYLFLDEDWKRFKAFTEKVVSINNLTLIISPIEAVADQRMPGTFLQGGKTVASDKGRGLLVVAIHSGQVLALVIFSRNQDKLSSINRMGLYYSDTVLLREWEEIPEIGISDTYWDLGWGYLGEYKDGRTGWILDTKYNDPTVLESIVEKWWLLEFMILQAAISGLKKDIEYAANPSRTESSEQNHRLLTYKFDVLTRHVKLFDNFINRYKDVNQTSLSQILIARARRDVEHCRENLSSAGIEVVPKTPRIFVSSTRGGLDNARSIIRDGLLANGLFPEMMEQFPSEDCKSKDACLKRVAQCDGLVLLLGSRYGWRPPGDDCSITKLEWLEAGRPGKKRAVVLFEGDATPKETEEDDEVGKLELANWKKELKNNLVIIVNNPRDYSWVSRLIASVK